VRIPTRHATVGKPCELGVFLHIFSVHFRQRAPLIPKTSIFRSALLPMNDHSSHVVIVGVGLMGGSLGLALRNADPTLTITGVDSSETLAVALQRGAITHGEARVEDAVKEADFVVIATPSSTGLSVLKELSKHVKEGAVVTDMCSVKGPIVALAKKALPDSVLFVGGHPMTGSERSGIRYADGLLFENATYVLCCAPESKASEGYHRLAQLISLTGARILELDAEKHDRIAARVSHLPQLLSVLLVNTAGRARKSDPETLSLAAGGFRDMTRIASSPFPMWRDILEENREEVGLALTQMEADISQLKTNLSDLDFEAIREQFHQAEQTRDFIPSDRKGFLKPLSDVFVFTSDRPGALVDITSTLFNASLSIKDIELLRIREGTGGTFRLGFHESTEADQAVSALIENGFSAYRL